jgi:hypothetical protein
MLDGQALPVHFVGEQCIGVQRFLHWDGSLEIRHLADRNVRAVEENLLSGIFQAGLFQNIAKANARPSSVADAAKGPLGSRHARLIETAAVAGALHNSHHFDAPHFLQIIHGQREGLVNYSIQLQTPLSQMRGLRRVGMSTDKELVDGRNPLIEPVERHFEIFGAG